MKTLWDEHARRDLLSRVDRLTPDTPPQWGRMSAGEMLAHCVEGMKMGLGELETRQRRGLLSRWPFKYVFVYWVRFPKGAPAPREVVTRGRDVDWSGSVAALRDSFERFSSRRDQREWPVHPVFGTLSGRAWGALGWRHLDHHLRQFGV